MLTEEKTKRGPICSVTTLHRLEEEAKQLMRKFSEDPPSVGDALFVEYDAAFCQKWKIGRFGRMTKKDGNILFHAGPQEIVHPSVYEMDDHNFLDYIHQWQKGGYCPVPVEKMIAGPKWPVPLQKKKKKHKTLSYEQEMFKKIGATRDITLVNPSFSTMTALKTSTGGYVTLTNPIDEDWSREVRNYVKNSKGRLQMLKSKTVIGIAYLGSNVPVWYPESEWFRLILSPFIPMSSDFKNYEVTRNEDSFFVRYEKKPGYVVNSILPRDSEFFLQNPETVDSWLGLKQGLRFFYFESTLDIVPLSEDDVKVIHSPWYLTVPEGLQWERIDNVYLKQRNGVVYDIRSSGTYLNRRTRELLPVGYEWAQFRDQGTHWVTYSSMKPYKNYGVSSEMVGQYTHTFFDGALPIRKLIGLEPQVDCCFTICPLEGFHSWPLWSDEEIYLVEMPKEEMVKYPREIFLSSLIMTERGQIFHGHSLVENGCCFVPGGQTYQLMGLGRGQLFPMKVFHTDVADYVVVPEKSGNLFLFPYASDLEMMCSTLSMFSRSWISTTAQVVGLEEDGAVQSDGTMGQTMIQLTQKPVRHLYDHGQTLFQISASTGLSMNLVQKYLLTSPGFYVWKVERGVSEYVYADALQIRVQGKENEITHDGRLWVEILRGHGALKDKYFFSSRCLQGLVRFLQWNYCMVQRVERNGYIEMTVRRPRRY